MFVWAANCYIDRWMYRLAGGQENGSGVEVGMAKEKMPYYLKGQTI